MAVALVFRFGLTVTTLGYFAFNAALIVIFFGEQLIAWYLGLF